MELLQLWNKFIHLLPFINLVFILILISLWIYLNYAWKKLYFNKVEDYEKLLQAHKTYVKNFNEFNEDGLIKYKNDTITLGRVAQSYKEAAYQIDKVAEFYENKRDKDK
jgi:hypothetical protein